VIVNGTLLRRDGVDQLDDLPGHLLLGGLGATQKLELH